MSIQPVSKKCVAVATLAMVAVRGLCGTVDVYPYEPVAVSIPHQPAHLEMGYSAEVIIKCPNAVQITNQVSRVHFFGVTNGLSLFLLSISETPVFTDTGTHTVVLENTTNTVTVLTPVVADNAVIGSISAMGNGIGIQCVAETVQHENGHINLDRIVNDPAWRDPLLAYPLNDTDGDYVPDIFEPTLMGIATDPNDPDTYRVRDIYPSYATFGDEDIRCQLLELNLTIAIFPEKDWANPGCQHKNQMGPKNNQ